MSKKNAQINHSPHSQSQEIVISMSFEGNNLLEDNEKKNLLQTKM